jgi:hypothetical protein
VADTSPERGRWAFRPVPPEPRSIVELIRAGTLDAELAATLWVLVHGRVPLIVAAEGGGAGKTTLLQALLAFLPANQTVVELRGVDETFDWMPHASELGWHETARHPTGPSETAHRGPAPIRPESTVLLAPEISDHLPVYTWGEQARIAVRAATIGYGLAATIHADSLEDVFDALRPPPVALGEDELSRLGVVLVLRPLADGRRRIVAAHYVRPTVRDEHGHVQRLGPAVLATWDERTDTFEHFGWGITPELATRIAMRPGDFELEVGRRGDLLAGLAEAGRTGTEEVRAAIDAYRPTTQTPPQIEPISAN